jgi:hypothetical protein
MIDGEENFVAKVKALERWDSPIRSQVEAGMALPGQKHQPLRFRAFRGVWWRIYEDAGEAGLRDYYRSEYVISASSLPIRLQRGDIVEDAEFAKFKRLGLEDP